MRGRQTSLSSKRRRLGAASSLIACLALLPGCSGSKEAEPKRTAGGSSSTALQRYERTFNPADYDADIKVVKQEEKTQRSVPAPTPLVTTAAPETVQGFRVQVLLTQEIDDAVKMKENVEQVLPGEWTYIVYDSPYYKVRVGNCEDRGSANPLVKKLNSLGFKEAWIVPDNVLKNLPPKPPDMNIELKPGGR
jgi:hypothetical protein